MQLRGSFAPSRSRATRREGCQQYRQAVGAVALNVIVATGNSAVRWPRRRALPTPNWVRKFLPLASLTASARAGAGTIPCRCSHKFQSRADAALRQGHKRGCRSAWINASAIKVVVGSAAAWPFTPSLEIWTSLGSAGSLPRCVIALQSITSSARWARSYRELEAGAGRVSFDAVRILSLAAR
jgi:hypothetical protein